MKENQADKRKGAPLRLDQSVYYPSRQHLRQSLDERCFAETNCADESRGVLFVDGQLGLFDCEEPASEET